MRKDDMLKRLIELIEKGEELYSHNIRFVKYNRPQFRTGLYSSFIQWRESCTNFIIIVAGKKSTFYESFTAEINFEYNDNLTYKLIIKKYQGILKALHEELQRGFLTNYESMISADILGEIQVQTNELLKHKYKDAAAIYCRVMLETSLKKICDKHTIEYARKDTINPLASNLKNHNIINTIEWRHIQSWTDIGNAAAHGEFDKYNSNEVKRMMEGIIEFSNEKLL